MQPMTCSSAVRRYLHLVVAHVTHAAACNSSARSEDGRGRPRGGQRSTGEGSCKSMTWHQTGRRIASGSRFSESVAQPEHAVADGGKLTH